MPTAPTVRDLLGAMLCALARDIATAASARLMPWLVRLALWM